MDSSDEKNRDEVSTTNTSSSSDPSSSGSGQLTTVQPPDGGWGWVIVIASFMCNMVVDGIIFSFGIFMMELSETFGETKAKTSWVGSLLAGCYLLIGPVVSALANGFGCRPVTVAGSIIAAAGFVASAFAKDVSTLMFSFGVVGGVGFGFIYLPATILASFYFEKKRAFATGIAVCGSGIGTFSMAPFVQYLTECYGWRGTLIILAGIILNCAVFGSLFRPLEPPPSRSSSPDSQKPLLLRIKEARDEMKKWDSETCLDNLLLSDTTKALESSEYEKRCSPTHSNCSPPPPYSEVVQNEKNMFTFDVDRKESVTVNCLGRPLNRKKRKVSRQDLSRPFYRQDILYSTSLIRIPEFGSEPNLDNYHMSVTKIPEHDEEDEKGCISPAVIDTFKQMLNGELLKSPTFLLLCFTGFLTLAGFFVPFIYVIDLATQSGIPKEQATLILSIIGITNTVGRVFSGWISDIPRVNALVVNNCALAAGGIATAFMPVVGAVYGLLLTCAAIFGFSIACFAALRSIIVVQLHGLENLSNAFGLLLLFQGIASVIGAPVAGAFFDATGSYLTSFFIAGGLIGLSGLLGFVLPPVSRWEQRRQAERFVRCEDETSTSDSDRLSVKNSMV